MINDRYKLSKVNKIREIYLGEDIIDNIKITDRDNREQIIQIADMVLTIVNMNEDLMIGNIYYKDDKTFCHIGDTPRYELLHKNKAINSKEYMVIILDSLYTKQISIKDTKILIGKLHIIDEYNFIIEAALELSSTDFDIPGIEKFYSLFNSIMTLTTFESDIINIKKNKLGNLVVNNIRTSYKAEERIIEDLAQRLCITSTVECKSLDSFIESIKYIFKLRLAFYGIITTAALLQFNTNEQLVKMNVCIWEKIDTALIEERESGYCHSISTCVPNIASFMHKDITTSIYDIDQLYLLRTIQMSYNKMNYSSKLHALFSTSIIFEDIIDKIMKLRNIDRQYAYRDYTYHGKSVRMIFNTGKTSIVGSKTLDVMLSLDADYNKYSNYIIDLAELRNKLAHKLDRRNISNIDFKTLFCIYLYLNFEHTSSIAKLNDIGIRLDLNSTIHRYIDVDKGQLVIRGIQDWIIEKNIIKMDCQIVNGKTSDNYLEIHSNKNIEDSIQCGILRLNIPVARTKHGSIFDSTGN